MNPLTILLPIIRFLVWATAVLAVAFGIVWGFYMILIYMLWENDLMWLFVAIEFVLWYAYWKIIGWL